MWHAYITKTVDIYQLPSINISKKGSVAIQITIGDLHGNSMKLMFMLITHGIASNINESDYSKLVEIYLTPTRNLTKEHIDEFNQILSKIEFSTDSLIRLIGDELADRGSNDYFTLKILEKLYENNVPVEIIASNHSIEFILACEKQDNFYTPILNYKYASSMENLQYLVNKEIVTREEILTIANSNYKPTLRAISYSLNENQKEITIYSHAGIGLNTIEYLAQKLEVEYIDTSARELAQTIDNINLRFQQHVQNNTVHTLYPSKKMEAGSENEYLINESFEFILWNRDYTHIFRPEIHYDYHVNFVHGHDPSENTRNNIYNLDNSLGKSDINNIGIYSVIYSANDICVITLSDQYQYFLSQMQAIKTKEQHLIGKGQMVAGNCAKNLYDILQTQHQALSEAQTDIHTFQNSCIDAINFARPELEKHRGWKQLLGNLAHTVPGGGPMCFIVGLINKAATRNVLFFKSDSANKIDQLESTVNSITKPK